MNERLGKRVGPYLWLLPSIVLMAIFVVFPIAIVFKLSFSEVSKSGVVGGFVGFKNFADAVSLPAFKTVMLNTLVWVVAVVGFSTIIGFIIAAIVGFLAIELVRWLVKTDKFKIFAYYTLALGVVVIIISIIEAVNGGVNIVALLSR